VLVSVFRELLGAKWLVAHQTLQGLGVLGMLAAFVVVVVASGTAALTAGGAHESLGLAIVAVGLAQPLLAEALRRTSWRSWWKLSHFVFALFLIAGGVANSVLGLLRVKDVRDAGLIMVPQGQVEALWVLFCLGAALSLLALLVHAAKWLELCPSQLRTRAAARRAPGGGDGGVESATPTGLGEGGAQMDKLTESESSHALPPDPRANPPFWAYDQAAKNDEVTELNLT
jgi:uncharacterized membrane protein YidH (DUF202 family)